MFRKKKSNPNCLLCLTIAGCGPCSGIPCPPHCPLCFACRLGWATKGVSPMPSPLLLAAVSAPTLWQGCGWKWGNQHLLTVDGMGEVCEQPCWHVFIQHLSWPVSFSVERGRRGLFSDKWLCANTSTQWCSLSEEKKLLLKSQQSTASCLWVHKGILFTWGTNFRVPGSKSFGG